MVHHAVPGPHRNRARRWLRTGFSTVIARYPDDRLTVIVLTNLQGAHAYSIARGVAAFYNGDYRPISLMRPRRTTIGRERRPSVEPWRR